MRRLLPLFLGVAAVWLAAQPQEPVYQEPEEEDEDLARATEYFFNPLQARQEFRVGEFYWKRSSFKAAAGRYEEASKWDPGYAEAFFKLGEARLKLADAEKVDTEKDLLLESAAEAYRRYIELEPRGKHAGRVRRELARLERR